MAKDHANIAMSGKALPIIIGTNLDITERNQAQVQAELHAAELENTNTALRVLLKQVNENKTEMESKVLDNFSRLVNPYLDLLEENLAHTPQQEYIKIASRLGNDESYRQEIVQKINKQHFRQRKERIRSIN